MTEMLEPLWNIALECIDNDEKNRGRFIEYDDEDVIHATIIFQHIMTNRLAHKMGRTGVFNPTIGEEVGKSIRNIVMVSSGLDTREAKIRTER